MIATTVITAGMSSVKCMNNTNIKHLRILIRKFDKKDEFERYLKDPIVSDSILENGALGWWKVSIVP